MTARKQPAGTDVPAQIDDEGAATVAPERGLLGDEVDQTPNLHYTVAGVTAGLPTPETPET